MDSSQPKSNGKRARTNETDRIAPGADRSLLPGLDAPADVLELLHDLWKPHAREHATKPAAEVARVLRSRLGDGHEGWEAPRVRRARQLLDRYLGVAPKIDTSVPALLRVGPSAPLALTFGGQSATGYFDELLALWRESPSIRPLVEAVGARLTAELAGLPPSDAAYLTDGVDLERWLDDPTHAPSPDYLMGIVSQPALFVTQVGHYLRVLAEGYARDEFFGNVRAVAGHSQGIMAALLVAETWGQTDLVERAQDYAAYLFYQALRMRQAFRIPALPPAALAEAHKAGVGTPTPMASIQGLTTAELCAVLGQLGLDLHLALDNGRLRKVVSGHPADLEVLRRALLEAYEAKKKAKAQGRHGGRMGEHEFAYLPFGGPYHSPLMTPGVAPMLADCARMRLRVDGRSLALPVLDAATGDDLRDAPDIIERVVRLQFLEPVRWARNAQALVERGARYILDFGPGEGVMRLTAAAIRGLGALALPLATEPGRKAALAKSEAPALPTPYAAYAPTLVETPAGTLHLDNPYTRFTGRAPVFLPGMTPTTVDAEIVVAAANAGFTSELAGGGQVTAAMLRRRVEEVARQLVPPAGIVLNALYLDPYLWKLQFGDDKLVVRLRDEGYPLVGVTVSAGVPSVEEAVPLLRELVAHGMWQNAFKPGTDAQIRQVLAIADAAPDLTITVHIEGGKAGGHHSWEDLQDVLARHYDSLRQRPNLLIAVGGGIATEEQATAYLLGTWSVAHELPPMPIDAVFLGTLAMAAKEAHTAPAVKQALVGASGTKAWVLDSTHAGGVTSGRSQLDASIYYLENDAARAGRLLDEIVKTPETIPERKAEIVAALAKTAKPYFGDVEVMTYAALLARTVELMAVGSGGPYEDGCWLDRTHRRRFLELVRLSEARLHGGTEPFASIVAHEGELDDPEDVLARFAAAYPRAASTTVHPQDVRAFVEICRAPGKPVNFVPVIDADIRRWYKSDSLWQSHDPRFGAEATLVIPGPEAVAGIRRADEPIAEMLGRFAAHAVRALEGTGVERRRTAWSVERRRPPKVDTSSGSGAEQVLGAAAWGPAQGVVRCDETLGREASLARLSALGTGPLAAALGAREVMVEAAALTGELRWVANPLARALAPEAGWQVEWRRDDQGVLRELVLEDPQGRVALRLGLPAASGPRHPLAARIVAADVARGGGEAELDLCLDWVEQGESGYLAWRHDDYLDAQAAFYGELLFGERLEGVEPFSEASDEVRLRAAAVEAFTLATFDDSRGIIDAGARQAPLSMVFALAWRSIFRALAGARTDVMSLLHEENATYVGSGWPVKLDDVLTSRARLTSIEATSGGRRIVVAAELARGQEIVARGTSTFFVRAAFAAGASVRDRRAPFEAEILLADDAARSFLREQPWLRITDAEVFAAGTRLRVVCPDWRDHRDGEARTFEARGELRRGAARVGAIHLTPAQVPAGCLRHPVAEVCALLAAPSATVSLSTPRQLGTKRLRAPADMRPYARASGDFNPLHVSEIVARFAGLPGPIVHGMWTASSALHRVARLTADGDAARLCEVEARFLAPVLPGEALAVRARQTAVRRGSRVIELDVVVERDGAEQPVLSGTALVAPPRTAYVFPGQGLQRPGMGMPGYARSAAARAVWDEADTACRERLGFSLLSVVRDNPAAIEVRGSLYKHPNGVLYLTQFTQVAMAVMAVAQVRELEERGVFDPTALFCGHSVGEYAALGAIARVLPLPVLVEIVYQRGTTMDALVERDAAGRSPYAMGVIRPHHAGLTEDEARRLVAAVAEEHGLPLEIVNYNIRGKQYSVTGHVEALAMLAEHLQKMQAARGDAGAKPAYLPVPGVDVPFHSTLLRSGVPHFRETLSRSVPAPLDPAVLVDRYVPNLVAERFRLTRPFAEAVLAASDSPVVAGLLESWDEAIRDEASLARTLLIELLAYQFASPVRWIETQELLFAPGGIEQVVEVGLGEQPVLSNMAQATLAAMPQRRNMVRVLHTELHADELAGPVGVVEEDVPLPSATLPAAGAAPMPPAPAADLGAALPPTSSAASAPEPAAAPAATAPALAAQAKPHAPAASDVSDAPPSAVEALRVLLALQTKLRPEQLDLGESIDELLGGNSAKRNQVLADIAAEFAVGAIDRAYEIPLGELAKQLTARASGYEAPGKYLGAALEQTVARVLGVCRMSRADVIEYLGRTWGLASGRATSVLLRLPLAARDGTSSRGGALSEATPAGVRDRASAEAWLDGVVAGYGRELGISLSKPQAPAAAAAAVDATALHELEDKLLGKAGVLARAARALAGDVDEPAAARDDAAIEAMRTRLEVYEREHGAAYEAATAPQFDADKHVAFTSSWAWARRDVLAFAQALARGERVDPAIDRRLTQRLDAAAARAAAALATVASREGRQEDAERLRALAQNRAAAPRYVADFVPMAPTLVLGERGEWEAGTTPRAGTPDSRAFVAAMLASSPHAVRVEGHRSRLPVAAYSAALCRAAGEGLGFAGKTALVTGAGPGSIALALVRALLEGGARVVLTTSTYTPERLAFYRQLYQAHGAFGAELHVVPANQGSLRDIEALVSWITTARQETVGASAVELKGAWFPDILVPFGALGEAGHLGGGERAQAVLRVLLLGVERLMTAVAQELRARATADRRCHVLLPLSPNHGVFGGDSLYAESKAGLEAVLNKWRSEHHVWGRVMTLAGARIGWVRSTGLMSANDLLAAPLEAETGVRTFAPEEMGLLLAGLLDDEVRRAAESEPLVAELTGGFGTVDDLAERTAELRVGLAAEAAERKRRRELAEALRGRLLGAREDAPALVRPKGLPQLAVPIPEAHDLERLPPLDHLDLDRVVAIVGFGEVGPFGSARTRWAVERDGELSLEAVAELAWMTGRIRPHKSGAGWEDARTGAPVADLEIKARYERDVLEHAGIRLTDPPAAGFDPTSALSFVDVHLDQDLRFPAANAEQAEELRAVDPEHTRIQTEPDGNITVLRKRGAVVRVPRAFRVDRNVAGQVPTGWDPERCGIPKEVCEQVDRVTLFNLVATAEAFVAAGLEPEEVYAFLHPARVGITQSSGIGGMRKLARMYRDYYENKERQTDVLQETLINVIAGYVVQSYLGSYGMMSFPVGACATAAVSVETAVDKIRRDGADFVVAGGVDDYGMEGVVGFHDMNATAATSVMRKLGIAPRTLCRPNDRRRRGFVEGQGAGAILLCRASVAWRAGLPVYGIVAYAGSFGDGLQRSVPAPGLGALACAAEVSAGEGAAAEACDLAGRRRRIAEVRAQAGELAAKLGRETADRLVREACRFYGHDFYEGDAGISPLRGALAVLGLTPDDIAVVSKHDTSTMANDVNENRLHSLLQAKLGRTADLPLAVISQKSLTGHAKGAAAAWQLGGLLQVMADGVVPGNRNLEEVDPAMAELTPMTFTDSPIVFGRGRIRAGLLTSLGFGHVGALLAIAHPYLFWRMLDAEQRAAYAARLAERSARASRRLQRMLAGQEPLVTLRTKRPFAAKDGSRDQQSEEVAMLLNPHARIPLGGSTFAASRS